MALQAWTGILPMAAHAPWRHRATLAFGRDGCYFLSGRIAARAAVRAGMDSIEEASWR